MLASCSTFHMQHNEQGIQKAAKTFRALIDLGIRYDGGYYLTYRRWATARQVDLCYRRFRQFLAQKLLFNPTEVFQRDWYLHHKVLLA